MFPEIFTTQLMSFLEERSPSLAVQRITEYTEDYISLFTDLAVKYNVNIIGGSHFVEEEGKFIISPTCSDAMERLRSNINCILRRMNGNGGESARATRYVCLIRTAGKLRSKFAMTLSFLSLPVLRPIKAQKLFYAILYGRPPRLLACQILFTGKSSRKSNLYRHFRNGWKPAANGKYGYPICSVRHLCPF